MKTYQVLLKISKKWRVIGNGFWINKTKAEKELREEFPKRSFKVVAI